ncbi:MAG: outer membrane protein assembly factor BamD [Prevotellaceae bacterium]|jgi:outer membrane protein assembly factor BamD|nr:outer membrane protein assembly factor BamD [Prevotellaceae bacterium]
MVLRNAFTVLRFYSGGVALCAMLLAGACTTQYDKVLKSSDYALKYRTAGTYYEAGKYQKAAALYEQSAMYYRGLPQDDSLNFFLAKSYFKYGDIYSAEYYFSQFCNAFPRSPFIEEAYYLQIVSLYEQTYRYELDQAPSYKTLTAIDEFLYAYPKSEYVAQCKEMKDDLLQRIDEKQYEAAKLYYLTEDYKAATVALRTSVRDYPDSRFREEILYLMVAAAYKYAEQSYQHLQKDRYQAVIDEYYNFVSEFPDSKHRKEVERMFENASQQVRKEQAKNTPTEITTNN